MPRYSYLDFTVDSDDMNVPGSSDVTKPSEGWKGLQVNDSLRATNSAVRNLGDDAAKLPRNSDGTVNLGPNQGRIGTAAFQDAGTIGFGTSVVLGPNARGSIGGNVLIMIVCNFNELDAIYAEQRTRGFDLCDGRVTTNPYPPFNVINRMPNYMGRFPYFADFGTSVGTFQFSRPPPNQDNNSAIQAAIVEDARRSYTVGNHNHGNTGATQLGYAELPTVVTSVSAPLSAGGGIAQGNDRLLVAPTAGSGANGVGHIHSTGDAGMHVIGTNEVPLDVRPPAIAVLPFLRVW